uniref:LRRCT domain-containing protein n=1 Tax=Strongyloides venezuelensis TaxID=75913 RepID=A0A0K0F2F5_STRVS
MFMSHRFSKYDFDESLETLPHEGDYYNEDSEESVPICGKSGLCNCEKGNESVVDCRKENFGTQRHPLDTTNLAIRIKNFTPFRVLLQHNIIDNIEKSKIMPGHEGDIVELDLSYNHIHNLGRNVFLGFEKLKVLKLSHNRIEKIFPFNKLHSLHKLHLDNNILGTLTDNVFDSLINLNELVLDGNEGINLNNKIFSKGLQNLTILSLDYCELEELPKNIFENLINLKQLSLRGNPFVTMPSAINAISHLSVLDMSNTNLPEFDKMALREDHELETIFMQNMKYIYMINDCAFCRLKKIKRIDFSNSTHLYHINSNAFGLVDDKNNIPENLTILNFENCNLTTIDYNLLDWRRIMSLKISGNPLNCDCNLSWLINNKDLHRTFGDILPNCYTPEEFNGKHIHDVVLSECDFIEKSSLWMRFIVIFLLVCGFILIWLFCSGNLNILGKRNIEMPEMGYRNLIITCEDDNPFANINDKEEI